MGNLADLTTFQSTLPTRGSDKSLYLSTSFCKMDFNPRSPRGGATIQQIMKTLQISISIHAPHEGERLCRAGCRGGSLGISIHAPHEGERPRLCIVPSAHLGFQSTLPTRGSDGSRQSAQIPLTAFQSTLPTRGSDPRPVKPVASVKRLFQSTLPTRGSDGVDVL